ncbi:helix-turn-helix transcriptional regulator [Aromatoleum petrolei]|uniref:WYL domain-containing protein n=1 Tax=Aromatoleum petrolei TaxID=76116 RepID=A0ABX1MTG9_9RHOO|nr:WYL domain-containing protein [Aromatoleum petrolei]NMF91053.1 WYL domain-containing protein [Aromatoleum petrolei]QTQ38140.1 Putative transcriptional regulator [Aromatoleum petrolei]
MAQAARLRDIVAILEARKHPVPRDVLLNELDVSLATFKRDIEVLRDQFQAPITWLPGEAGRERGYVLEDKGWSSGKLGLPRAWFTSSEIHALLMIDTLASHIAPGLLTEHLQPLITRITLALSAADDTPEDIRSRIQILASAARRRDAAHFENVAQATVRRNCLEILYFTKSRNERNRRVVSPQRLIHYKENWYLVAWCHKAEGPRVFALDGVEEAKVLKEPAVEADKAAIDAMVGKDFGIYSGGDRKWAKLRFSALQARWVEAEVWHPEQTASVQEDGSLVLEVPYSDPRELLLDVLKFGPEAEVLEPPELREEVRSRLRRALSQYE